MSHHHHGQTGKPQPQGHVDSPAGTASQTYGFVKCLVVGRIRLQSSQLPSEVQYHLHADLKVGDDEKTWDTAINVGTSDSDDLLNYRVVQDFHHPIIESLKAAAAGFHNLTGTAKLPALDFLRSDILAESGPWRPSDPMDGSLDARPVSYLKKLLDKALEKKSDVYIFGRTYKDGSPGVHDVHMNQGSKSPHLNRDKDGNDIWQDGGVLFDFGDPQWVGYFTAFTQQLVPTNGVGDPLANSHPISDADVGSLVGK